MAGYFPERGDIIHLNFTPAAGREMTGQHYAIVVSTREFSRVTRKAWICPITSTIRHWPFEVRLPAEILPLKKGEKGSTESVVLTDHIRSVDYAARGAKRVATTPDEILREVVEKILPVLEF